MSNGIIIITEVTKKSDPLKDGFRTLSERTEIIISIFLTEQQSLLPPIYRELLR